MEEEKLEFEEVGVIEKKDNKEEERIAKEKKRGKIISLSLSIFCIIIALTYIICCPVNYNYTRKKHVADSTKETQATTDTTDVDSELEEILKELGISDTALSKLSFIKLLANNYYLFSSDDTDYDSGIIKGYVEALNDKYTVYYTADEYATMLSNLNYTLSGIGVRVTQDKDTGYITVVKSYEGAPAYETGIREKDILYKVNGEEIVGQDMDLVVSKIRGEEGTNVDITVYRSSENKYLDFTITRRLVSIDTVESEMLENNIGYIIIDTFGQTTSEEFKTKYEELENQGMTSLIIDVRNNGGGYTNAATEILDYLLPEMPILSIKQKDGTEENTTSDANYKLNIPLVVLVDEGTASSSEILTGNLKGYKDVTIVGEKTYGKGVVQNVFPFSDGSAVKMTVAYYYLGNGTCIHGEGIEPDVKIGYGTGEEDEQLNKAIEILTK